MQAARARRPKKRPRVKTGIRKAGCGVTVSHARVSHILKHGNYLAASRSSSTNVPSYFKNSKVMVTAIRRTLLKPSWKRQADRSRAMATDGTSVNQNRVPSSNRYFFFKKFKRTGTAIGNTGRGHPGVPNNMACYCCMVLIDHYEGLVTAYPVLTEDALTKGQGQALDFNEVTTTESLTESEEGTTKTEGDEDLDFDSDTTLV